MSSLKLIATIHLNAPKSMCSDLYEMKQVFTNDAIFCVSFSLICRLQNHIANDEHTVVVIWFVWAREWIVVLLTMRLRNLLLQVIKGKWTECLCIFAQATGSSSIKNKMFFFSRYLSAATPYHRFEWQFRILFRVKVFFLIHFGKLYDLSAAEHQ